MELVVRQNNNVSIRDKIASLQASMEELPKEVTISAKESDENFVSHFFAPGVYVRQIKIPAGMVVVGKIHKTKHVSIISCGIVTVVTENGQETIHAPHTFINEPGEKRALYTHTDTVWTTIHPTEETDLEKIEDLVIAKDYNDPVLLAYNETLLIEKDNKQ